MTQRVSKELVAHIRAALERDPYANIPDSAFRQAGALRPNLDDVPVELRRADVRDLLADLEEARRQRLVLREALQRRAEIASWFDGTYGWRVQGCPVCYRPKGESHTTYCFIGKALAATEATSG